jgi:ABC-type multidrug transport system ATPase subunit
MAPLVTVEHLYKSFPLSGWKNYLSGLRRHRMVLRDISLEIPACGWIGLYGSNGSGKTTFLRCLAGLLIPDRGDIIWRSAEQPAIGYCAGEDRGFHPRLSVMENLQFYAGLFNVPRTEFKQIIQELTQEFGLEDLFSQQYQQLSTGQKQRINLVRSLLIKPELIIFDEVGKSLDILFKQRLCRYIQDVLVKQKGCLVLWVSHDPHEIITWCNEMIHFHRGQAKIVSTASFNLLTEG